MSSSNNTNPMSPTTPFYTPQEIEAAKALLTLREPVIFSKNGGEGQGTTDPRLERRGAVSTGSSSNGDVCGSADEAEKKLPRKISLSQYTAMKKARAAKEAAEQK